MFSISNLQSVSMCSCVLGVLLVLVLFSQQNSIKKIDPLDGIFVRLQSFL